MNRATLFSMQNFLKKMLQKWWEISECTKIPYKVEDNESAIKVPKEKVYEARLALAGKGVPDSGVIGYEIFDKNTMGMSDFMQKLNYKTCS